MRSFVRSVCSIILWIVAVISPTSAQEFYYGGQDSNNYFDESVDMWSQLKDATVNNDNSILNTLLRLFELDSYDGPDKALRYIRWVINLALSFVSLIVLVWLIYGFYMMFFSSEEEGISRARKIIKVCTIAIVLIALSWLLSSFFFYIYYTITGG